MWTENIAAITINLSPARYPPGAENDGVSPSQDLLKLGEFRELRSLAVRGMIGSHQGMIWEAVWNLPYLRKLDLRMAIGPDVPNGDDDWPFDKLAWKMRGPEEIIPLYR